MLNYETCKRSQPREKNPRWKGDDASYTAKHQFLIRNYGNPTHCELCNIEGHREKGGRWSVHWSKKKDREYTHDRDDYIGLCRSCHRKYDITEEELKQLSCLSKNITVEQKQKMSLSQKKAVLSRKRNKHGRFTKTT